MTANPIDQFARKLRPDWRYPARADFYVDTSSCRIDWPNREIDLVAVSPDWSRWVYVARRMNAWERVRYSPFGAWLLRHLS